MKTLKMKKQFLLENPKAAIGILIVASVCLMCLFAPLLTQYDPTARIARPHQPPSWDNLLGTTRMGRDVWAQVLYGGRISLMVGFVAGSFVILMAMIIGIASGYFGGVIDNVLSFFTNLVMVIPSLPLMLVLAAKLLAHRCVLHAFVHVRHFCVDLLPYFPNVPFVLGCERYQRVARLGSYAGPDLSSYTQLNIFVGANFEL